MNKTAIKNFAVSARRKLIEQVKQKAYEIGITDNEVKEPQIVSSDTMRINDIQLKKYQVNQRKKLIEKIRERGYEQVIEEVAYTWFNRFIAIRFMEVNGYLPTGVRVLSSIDPDKTEPDIIKEASDVDLDIDKEIVYMLQDSHDTEELFKYLLVKQCNALHEIMPVVFEEIVDYTEILLPDHLLQEGSVIRDLVSSIEEKDWTEQVEIIGWLYQYYISEKKDEVFEGLKKNIKITKENIPAATQLFTPDWIVKYMVENSLGRLWLESHPNDELKAKWKYYLDEAEQEPGVLKQLEEIREKNKIDSPEDIKFLDPCMGSGHILVYAYDVLYDIYKSEGYSERDIPRLILEKNLYGLEIDDRAAQLAYFAVMMKARSSSRRIFRDKIELNLCSIQESNGISIDAIDLLVSPKEIEIEKWVKREEVEYLVDVFNDAKEYGSILDVGEIDFGAIERRLQEIKDGETLNIFELQQRNVILDKVPWFIRQGRLMSQKYDVICTNPPYMGNGGMSKDLSDYVKTYYPSSKTDLSTVFMEKTLSFCKDNGYMSMINIPVWMSLSSCEDLRKKLIENRTIINMLHCGRGIFGSDFGSVTFVFRNQRIVQYRSSYRRLYFRQGAVDNVEQKEKWFFEGVGSYTAQQEDFLKIPGNSFSYWISKNTYQIFNNFSKVGDVSTAKQGLITGSNEIFMRFWYEVSVENFTDNCKSREETKTNHIKWYPFNKGGDFRKWYGNNYYVVNWENDGYEIQNFRDNKGKLRSRPQNLSFYFKSGLTWTALTAGVFSMRFSPRGFLFESMGPVCFPNEDKNCYFILGLLNSIVGDKFLKILSPNLKFDQKPLEKVPFPHKVNHELDELVKQNISITKNDWDSYEISWDFKCHPLLNYRNDNTRLKIEDAFKTWGESTQKQFEQIKSNEEKLNCTFIDIYGLQDELSPLVEDKDITIRKADRERDIKSFISYAVGCIFGRYSLYEEGLIYAGGRFDTTRYKTFEVSMDNVIPILDDEYFEKDIVNRFVDFVRITFGSETLEENLDYIAEALGKKSTETSRQTFRRYFLKDFYKDHVQVYQKRPIYWLLESGKNDGFKALIYMHRYDVGTVATVRTDYLHKLQKKYEAEVSRLDIVISSDVSEREKAAARKRKEKIEKQMQECMQYDQVIAHVANQKISIDLDDGVAVNYAKFQDVLIPQGEGKKPLKADLLAKI